MLLESTGCIDVVSMVRAIEKAGAPSLSSSSPEIRNISKDDLSTLASTSNSTFISVASPSSTISPVSSAASSSLSVPISTGSKALVDSNNTAVRWAGSGDAGYLYLTKATRTDAQNVSTTSFKAVRVFLFPLFVCLCS